MESSQSGKARTTDAKGEGAEPSTGKCHRTAPPPATLGRPPRRRAPPSKVSSNGHSPSSGPGVRGRGTVSSTPVTKATREQRVAQKCRQCAHQRWRHSAVAIPGGTTRGGGSQRRSGVSQPACADSARKTSTVAKAGVAAPTWRDRASCPILSLCSPRVWRPDPRRRGSCPGWGRQAGQASPCRAHRSSGG